MTVHVLMPVHNRVAHTKSMLSCVRSQIVDEALVFIVIDDGSTDDTSQYLAEQADLIVLQGRGELWWGGAIDLGLRYVFDKASDEDWVVFVNNDTLIRERFIQALLDTARVSKPAAVGSVIRDINPPHDLVSIGPRIDVANLLVWDALNDARPRAETIEVDALSGRGVLYSVEALKAVGGMRSGWLPHYLADYELALRVKCAGWRLVVNYDAITYSDLEFGNAYKANNWRDRFFSVRSPAYLPANIRFWWVASTFLQKIAIPFVIICFSLFPGLRRRIRVGK